jgi:hypothetical protein
MHCTVPSDLEHRGSRAIHAEFACLSVCLSSYKGLPEHVLAQEPDRPLEAFTGPFSHLVYGTAVRKQSFERTVEGEATADGHHHGVEMDDNGRHVRRNLKPQWERVRTEGMCSR